MKIRYESEDGLLFDNEEDCYAYEAKQKHCHLKTIAFFDRDNNQYSIEEEDIFNDDVYHKAEQVVIHDMDELNDFIWLAEECGWCEFTQLIRPGIWIRKSTRWGGEWYDI